MLYFHWLLLMLARPRAIKLRLGRPQKISMDGWMHGWMDGWIDIDIDIDMDMDIDIDIDR